MTRSMQDDDGNKLVEEGTEIVLRPVDHVSEPEKPREPAGARSERATARVNEEMEAGRRRVQYLQEQAANRPPVVLSEAEKKATGSSTPVFRPGDFREYANMRVAATSKG